MSDGTVYRVGIDFKVNDSKLKTALRAWGTGATSVGKKFEKLNAQLVALDTTALKGFKAELASLGKITADLRGGLKIRESEARVQKTVADIENKRLLTLGRINRESARTAEIADKSSRRAEESASRQAILAERLAREKMRTLLVEERISRQKVKQTADEKQLAHLAHEARKWDPRGGNSITSGMLVGGMGVNSFKYLKGLPHAESFHHYQQELGGLQRIGLSGGETRQALATASGARSAVPGLSMAGSIDVMKDMFATFGKGYLKEDPHGDLAKLLGKFMVTNKASFGLSENQSYAAVKVAELMAKATAGMTEEQKRDAFGKSLNLEHKILGGLGGKVKPNDLYSFTKTGGTILPGLSNQGFAGMASIVQEMGGPRAGTALTSFVKGLTTTFSNKGVAGALVDAKLYKSSDIVSDHGHLSRRKGAHIKGEQMLLSDPAKWAVTYLTPLTKGLNDAQVGGFLKTMFGNRTAELMASILVRQSSRIHSEQSQIAGAPGIEATDRSQKSGNFIRAEMDFETAWDNLKIKMTEHLLPGLTNTLNKLADIIDYFNKMADASPGAAKGMAVTGAVGAVGVPLVIGGIMMASGVKSAWMNLFGTAAKEVGQNAGKMIVEEVVTEVTGAEMAAAGTAASVAWGAAFMVGSVAAAGAAGLAMLNELERHVPSFFGVEDDGSKHANWKTGFPGSAGADGSGGKSIFERDPNFPGSKRSVVNSGIYGRAAEGTFPTHPTNVPVHVNAPIHVSVTATQPGDVKSAVNKGVRNIGDKVEQAFQHVRPSQQMARIPT
jgi:hypothetical protein